MAVPAIRATGLVKRFGKTEALRGIDLCAGQGSVLALLGPNGAGKTTAVRILSTLLPADSGTAHILGYDVVRQPQQVRARIGLTGQFSAVDEPLTGFENLVLVGRLAGLRHAAARHRAAELLDRLGLGEAADRTANTYSGGMRRRLDIAASLMTEPPILVLDEPTTGLDARGRLSVWEMVDEMVSAGTTVLLTSQYLEEVDRLAHNIVVVDGGLTIAEGTPQQLKAQVGGGRLVVTLAPAAELGRRLEQTAAIIAGVGASEVRTDPRRREASVAVTTRLGLLPRVVRDLDLADIEVEDLAVRQATLDDVFLALTGRSAGPTADQHAALPPIADGGSRVPADVPAGDYRRPR
jgi:ABC-2 type transport system ATP-binding protein